VSQVAAFHEAANRLDAAQVVWWLSDGAALGAVRDGGFVPSDPDVDIGYRAADHPSVLAAFDDIERLPTADVQYRIGRTKVDLHPHFDDGDTVWFPLGTDRRRFRYRFPLFDLQPAVFHGRPVLLPSPTDRYLTAHYGDDWHVPQAGWRWDTSPPCVEPDVGHRVSVTIMAHPKRQAWAEQLADQLGCPVVWDRHNNVWDTARRAWLSYLPGTAHHLVVQDDAVLTDGLADNLPAVLSARPGQPVSLATIGYRLKGRLREWEQTAARHERWFPLETGVATVALAVPTVDIPKMIADCDRMGSKHDDVRIASWFRQQCRPVWHTVPSLVDHRDSDVNPTLVAGNGRPGVCRAAVGFVDTMPHVDWMEGVMMADGHATFLHVKTRKPATVQVGSKGWQVMSASPVWRQIDPAPGEEPEPGPAEVVEVPNLGEAASGPVALGGGWYDVHGERVRGADAAREAWAAG
jgi:hypothetical protein